MENTTNITEDAISMHPVEPIQEPKKAPKKFLTIGITALVLLAVFYFWANRTPLFCFNFTPDMHFGDREGQVSQNMFKGVPYFIYEVGGLHTALQKEGFYIDPLELDGGRIYLGAFFGPSTQVAVRDFQDKYGLEVNGFVDEQTLLQLNNLYQCPALPTSSNASTTPLVTASSTFSNK